MKLRKILLSYASLALGFIACWRGFVVIRSALLVPDLFYYTAMKIYFGLHLVAALIFIPLGSLTRKPIGYNILKNFSIIIIISSISEAYFLISNGFYKKIFLPVLLILISAIILIISLKKLIKAKKIIQHEEA